MNRPPIVVFAAFFYGAGLATGLVFLVNPWAVLVLILAYGLVVSLVGRGHLGLLYIAGLLVGTVALMQQGNDCKVRWQSGNKRVQVVLHDNPGVDGFASGSVVQSADGCDGDIFLALPNSSQEGGSLLSVTGNYRTGVLRVTDLTLVRRRESLRFFLRSIVDRRIAQLYGARSGVVAAMVIGRKNDIPRDMKVVFSRAGMSHLLAISGLHVGIIAGWIFLGAGLFGFQRLRSAVVLFGVWAYVGMLGFPAPATRAAIFITVRVVATRIERSPPPVSVLAVAAMGVFTIDPSAIQSIGSWLSILAVWGTALAARELKRFELEAPVLRLLGASLGATLATVPVTAVGFGAVAPIGVLANLVAVPLTGLIVPAVFASLAGGPILAGGAGLLIWLLESVAGLAAAVPGGHLEGHGFGFGATWLALSWICFRAIRRRPTWLRMRLRLLMGGASFMWVGVVLSASWVNSSPGLEVFVLDVGQGDAIAIKTPHGRWMLIDAGPKFRNSDAGARVVVPFLNRMGVESLDLLFVSHGDADHLGGVPSVLRAFRAGLVVDPGQPLSSGLFREYLDLIDEFDLAWQAGRTGDSFLVDSVRLTIIHPAPGWADRELDPNENSLVILLEYESFSMLLTGDAGLPAEERFLVGLSDIDVLKVGHHGSSSATSMELLQVGNPAVAVISVGAGNKYGHPTQEVLGNLATARIDVVRTDMGGTVTISANRGYFDIRQRTRESFLQGLRCLLPISSLSNGLSSNRNVCSRRPRAISRAYSTTSHSQAR